jgi:hypothetical protein
MKIEFKTEGGIAYFPGLSKPVLIDSSELSEEENRELERLLDISSFFELPMDIGPSPQRGVDYRRYTIKVDDGRRSHTVQLVDPVGNADLVALLDYLRAKARTLKKRKKDSNSAL